MIKKNQLYSYISQKFLQTEIKEQNVSIVSVSISDDQADFHQIVKFNEAFRDKFGIDEDIYQLDMEDILPDLIADQHKGFIKNYISTNQE